MHRDGKWARRYQRALELERKQAAKRITPAPPPPPPPPTEPLKIQPNLVRPPGPIPSMREVDDARFVITRAPSQGGALRHKLIAACELVRRSPLYVGDDAARNLLRAEKQLGLPLKPVWITAAGRELWPKPDFDPVREMRETPYGGRLSLGHLEHHGTQSRTGSTK